MIYIALNQACYDGFKTLPNNNLGENVDIFVKENITQEDLTCELIHIMLLCLEKSQDQHTKVITGFLKSRSLNIQAIGCIYKKTPQISFLKIDQGIVIQAKPSLIRDFIERPAGTIACLLLLLQANLATTLSN